MQDVEAVLARVAERRPRVIDLSLDRVFAALDRLGGPHRRLPPTFHVAGTNGKGSTVAFLRSILERAGKRVHVYTSPHLVRFNERIVLAGRDISDAALIDALERCDAAVGDDKLTYFETTT
ncbi:MAG: bifunctional folylpolyglutamate synthase/dihydrofolate synthase, partial [Hyphococcus sp.]